MIFVGTEFDHQLEFGINLDNAVTIQIRYKKPDGTTANLTATRIGTSDVLRHLFTTAELNVAGMWKANAYVDYGSGKVHVGDTVEFMISNLGDTP